MKEGVEGAETWPAKGGAGREDEVTAMQRCQGEEHRGVCAGTCARVLLWLLAFTH